MLAYLGIIVFVAIATIFFLFIDSRLFDRPKKRSVYIKAILMNVIIVMSVIFLLTWLSPTDSIKDVINSQNPTKINAGPVIKTPVGEDMLAGEAPF
jgi:hypothetical protein